MWRSTGLGCFLWAWCIAVDSQCFDCNFGGLDRHEQNCTWYGSNSSACGLYDDVDFAASSQCCACGNGASSPGRLCAVPAPEHNASAPPCFECTDGVDSGGDPCAWYAHFPRACGYYDDADFVAHLQCCECGGGLNVSGEVCDLPMTSQEPGSDTCYECTGGALDTGDDPCSWYATNAYACGQYDTQDFLANLQCCECGGGSNVPGRVCMDHDVTCFSCASGVDTAGDPCSWYSTHREVCGSYDDSDFKANIHCCECDGGTDAPGGECEDSEAVVGTQYDFDEVTAVGKGIFVLFLMACLACSRKDKFAQAAHSTDPAASGGAAATSQTDATVQA
mmetsp:Transcript_34287/g.91604  ORF Transcript_34287/g.91604 Transcript_34287/m.91604 type:complete len:335 (-) Transcript_34287:262-1266(-)